MENQMKAAWLKTLHRFDMVDVDVPKIQTDQVLVKIEKVGICGSDRGMWKGEHFFNDLYGWERFQPGEHGHEASGTVIEVGSDVAGVKEGDLAVRLSLKAAHDLEMKCFAEYAVADAPIIVNGADPEVVCFTDPVVVALNHIHHANLLPGDTALVIGQGFIGLLITQLLHQRHVNVIATEIRENKMTLAKGFGAEIVDARQTNWEERVEDLSRGSVRAIIECSGVDSVVEAACRLLARGGTIVVMGAYRKTICLNYTQLRIRGATVKFPMNGVGCKDNWESAAEILHHDGLEVKSLISHRDRLENIQDILENYEEDWLRVVLTP